MLESPHRPSSPSRIWARYLELAGSIGEVVISLRDKPRAIDWLAAAARVASIGYELSTARARPAAMDAVMELRGWTELPTGVAAFGLQYATNVTVVAEVRDAKEPGPFRVRGHYAAESIEWVDDGSGNVLLGPCAPTERLSQTLTAIGESIWAGLHTRDLVLDGHGLHGDARLDASLAMTAQFDALRQRIGAFHRAGFHRSLLLEGPAGTGKSTGSRQLANAFDLRTLRIDFGAFEAMREDFGPHIRLQTLLDLLHPGAILIDDLDRLDDERELLAFLEEAHRCIQLVIATANDRSRLDPATLRPGRFDEIIRVDQLDPRIVAELVGDPQLAEEVRDWPAAYVAELHARKRALGSEAARAEMAELRERIGVGVTGGVTPRLAIAVLEPD